jgi:flagellar biosynthetic protein FliP
VPRSAAADEPCLNERATELRNMKEHGCSTIGMILLALLASSSPLRAQSPSAPASPDAVTNDLFAVPDAGEVLPTTETREGVSTTLKIFVIMTLLTLAPALIVMTTSFTRIIIVLALLRQAIGVQQLPPSQVLTGLSLFLTFLVMGPTWDKINSEALQPYLNNQISQSRAIDVAGGHVRTFMFDQIERVGNEEDIYLFVEYARKESVPTDETLTRDQVRFRELVPAFILSELKTAFVMGFRVYLPFLVIDMVIATVLISMGMLMLPPVLISLPFKLLLFVMADGWHLVVGSLLMGFS